MLMVGDNSINDGGPPKLIKESMHCRGTPTAELKKQSSHEKMRNTLFDMKPTDATFRTFRSIHHHLEQQQITKRMLTAFNDKVYQESSTFSRPLGHWRNPRVEATAASEDEELL